MDTDKVTVAIGDRLSVVGVRWPVKSLLGPADLVVVVAGAFSGLTGEIIRRNGSSTLVWLPGIRQPPYVKWIKTKALERLGPWDAPQGSAPTMSIDAR